MSTSVGSQGRNNPLLLVGEIIILLAILLLAAYLRLTNVAVNPGWYTDEGTVIDIAQHLQRGQVQYMVFNQSTLLVARLPLFTNLTALTFNLFGPGIETLRTLTGTLGVISIGLLYWVIRRTGQPGLGLLAALMMAIYPNAIIYSRIGFSYNLLTPLLLLAFWGMYEYLTTWRRGWLALAAMAIGIGSISDLMILNLLPPFVIVVLARRWCDLLWSLPLLATPFVLYIIIMLLTVPEAFLFDARFTLLRIGALGILEQSAAIILNFTSLLLRDSWISVGIIGLFMIPNQRLRRLSLLLLLLPLITLGRTVTLSGLSYYYVTPLLPLIALGVGALIRLGILHVVETVSAAFKSFAKKYSFKPPLLNWAQTRAIALLTMLVAFYLVVAPFIGSIALTIDQMNKSFATQINDFLLNADDARQAADYVNEQVQEGDVVIASPGLAWALRADVADFQMIIAYRGYPTAHLPADIPQNRYNFDPSYENARFVVIDNLWHVWAIENVGGLDEVVNDVEENWMSVFESGDIQVYENPNES